MEPSPAQRAARDRIAASLARAGYALPGTLTIRSYACGKPGCRCHADPPRLHGPYAEWTRKIGGKTATRRLTPGELAEYQPLFDNARKLRALVSELQDLTLQIIEADTPGQPQSPEPQTSGPENVGHARLTCDQPPSQPPSSQVNPKREDVADLRKRCGLWFLRPWPLPRQPVTDSDLSAPVSGRASCTDMGLDSPRDDSYSARTADN